MSHLHKPTTALWGATRSTLAADLTLTNEKLGIQSLDPGGATRAVIFPAAGQGNPVFEVINRADAKEYLSLADPDGHRLGWAAPGDMVRCVSDGTNWASSRWGEAGPEALYEWGGAPSGAGQNFVSWNYANGIAPVNAQDYRTAHRVDQGGRLRALAWIGATSQIDSTTVVSIYRDTQLIAMVPLRRMWWRVLNSAWCGVWYPDHDITFDSGEDISLRYESGAAPGNGTYYAVLATAKGAGGMMVAYGGNVSGGNIHLIPWTYNSIGAKSGATDASVQVVAPVAMTISRAAWKTQSGDATTQFTVYHASGGPISSATLTLPGASGSAALSSSLSVPQGAYIYMAHTGGTAPAAGTYTLIGQAAGHVLMYGARFTAAGTYAVAWASGAVVNGAAGLDYGQIPVYAPGRITRITWSTITGDATTDLKVWVNGSSTTVDLTGAQGGATLSLVVEPGDLVGIEYDAGTAPNYSNILLHVTPS